MKLYEPFVSSSKNKKYSVYVKDNNDNKKLIHFGDKRYQHYEDKIGFYSNLNHYDKERRRLYLKRSKKITDKNDNLTYKNKNSSNYWSIKFLW